MFFGLAVMTIVSPSPTVQIPPLQLAVLPLSVTVSVPLVALVVMVSWFCVKTGSSVSVPLAVKEQVVPALFASHWLSLPLQPVKV